MCRTTRQVLRLILCLALTTFLASCGSGDSEEDDVYINLYSSTVYGEHSLAINAGGTLKAWGANGYGQLGIGSRLDKSTPETVAPPEGDSGYSAVSIGGAHGVALANDGTVWAWGHNSSGQLGDNTITTRSTPVQVLDTDGSSPLSGITAVAAGGRHTLALKSDGTVLAWGSNTKGQLGNNSTTNSKIPVDVGITDVVAIAAGGEFSLALKSDGKFWTWGSNAKGQLGDNSFETRTTPIPVQIIENSVAVRITAIAAGGSHVLAIDEAGKIWAWGFNGFGQLGDGSTTTSKVAVKISLPNVNSMATSISAGLDHTLAVIDGVVYSWGYNKYGQLGNGAALDSDLPVTARQKVVLQDKTNLPGIKSVTAVGHHSLARATDDTFYSWGKNTKGQLGVGTRISRSYAAPVSGF